MEAQNDDSFSNSKRGLYICELMKKNKSLIDQMDEVLINLARAIDCEIQQGENDYTEINDQFHALTDTFQSNLLNCMEKQKRDFVFGDNGFPAEVSFLKSLTQNESNKNLDINKDTFDNNDDDRIESKNSFSEEDYSDNDGIDENKNIQFEEVSPRDDNANENLLSFLPKKRLIGRDLYEKKQKKEIENEHDKMKQLELENGRLKKKIEFLEKKIRQTQNNGCS